MRKPVKAKTKQPKPVLITLRTVFAAVNRLAWLVEHAPVTITGKADLTPKLGTSGVHPVPPAEAAQTELIAHLRTQNVSLEADYKAAMRMLAQHTARIGVLEQQLDVLTSRNAALGADVRRAREQGYRKLGPIISDSTNLFPGEASG